VSRRKDVKFRLNASSHPASPDSSVSVRDPPAELTSTSTCPSAFSAAAATSRTPPAVVTSPIITAGSGAPEAAIVSASSFSSFWRRAVSARRAPSFARTRATPAPIPTLAPVTRQALSRRSSSMGASQKVFTLRPPNLDELRTDRARIQTYDIGHPGPRDRKLSQNQRIVTRNDQVFGIGKLSQ